jgi:hypothetical protein
VGPDEKDVRDERAKSAQGGHKPELTESFAKINIERSLAKTGLPLLNEQRVFSRDFERAKDEKNAKHQTPNLGEAPTFKVQQTACSSSVLLSGAKHL